MPRCKCLIHYKEGEVVRCNTMTYHPDDKYCYHHKKYFEFMDYFPAPMQWKQQNDGPQGDYITHVSDLTGMDVRSFNYDERKVVPMW